MRRNHYRNHSLFLTMRPLRYLSRSYDARGDIFSYSDLSEASRFGHAPQQKRVRLTKNRVRVPCIVTDCNASYCAAAGTVTTPANKTTIRMITTENEAIFIPGWLPLKG